MEVQLKGGPRDGEKQQIKHPGNAIFSFHDCESCGELIELRYERVGSSRTYRHQRTHDCDIEDLKLDMHLPHT